MECKADQRKVRRRKVRIQHLYYVRYLKISKKGGRITPAVAALGTALRLKPVLQIQGEVRCLYGRKDQ